jgi:hypothetical protein
MNRTIIITPAKDQTAVTSRIFGIILDQNPLCDYTPHFLCRDHPLRPEHLPHRMRQVKQLDDCRRTHTGKDAANV